MKSKHSLFFLLLFVFFSGCRADDSLAFSPYTEVDTITDVWIEVDQTTVSSCGTKITIHNTSDRDDFCTGLWFCVERNEDGTWYSLPFQGETVGFPLIDIAIPTASEINSGFIDGLHYDSNSEISWRRYPPNELNCLWEDMYGDLPKGDYRLIISLFSKKDIPSEDVPKYYLSAPFSIG